MTPNKKGTKEAASSGASPRNKENTWPKDLDWREEQGTARSKTNDATTRTTPKKKATSGQSKSPRKGKDKKSELLDWRDSKYSVKTTPPAKSKGISPKNFHGNNQNSSRTRDRPGKDYVKAIHSQSQQNMLRAEKQEICKIQQVKRSAFKELTSLKTWPLQDMAMKDYQQLMQVYLGLDSTDVDALQDEPDHHHGASSESAASTDKKRIMTDKSLSPSKSQLKQRYKKEFLEELDIPDHNVVTASCDPSSRFDPGLWSMEPRVFSTERANGKRRYVVGHMGRVADLIWRKTDRMSRSFYEMILEDCPCRLYFDLEYSIPENPNIPANQLLNEFYEKLIEALVKRYPDHCEGLSRSCIVDMDSSTPQKFSRHWIVHLSSKALFKNSQEVGKFVKSFIQQLADQVATGKLYDQCPCLHDHLFVNPKGTVVSGDGDDVKPDLPLSKKTCFVDLGVYTRNRLFRLLGSAKYGKKPECALRFATTNKFPLPRGFGNEQFYVPAMGVKSESDESSSDEEDDDDALDDEQRDKAIEKFMAQTDWSLHAQVLCRTLVVPLNWRKIDYPLLPAIEDETQNNETKSSRQSTSLASTRSVRPTFGSSPYPYIDDFVENVLAIRGSPQIQGSIRAWTMDYTQNDSGGRDNRPQMPVGISYQMLRNRWCEAVGRHHKSNNVIWNIDFRTKQCVQTCYDPECRAMNFRGTPIDLPYDVVEQLDDALFEAELAAMDEQELLQGNVNSVTNGKDTSLEQAMSGLSLGGSKLPCAAKSSTNNPPQSPGFDTAFSDDALLQALDNNPDLFH